MTTSIDDFAMSNATFSLEPAVAGDVDAIQAVCSAAFRDDKQTIFKNMAKQSDNGTQAPIRDWIEGGRVKVLKAVDSTTKEIIGVVCWVFRGYDLAPTPSKASTAQENSSVEEQETEPESPPKDAIDRLNDYTDDDFVKWMDKIMPAGTKCIFICTIAVHPDHHRRGVGKALVQWGTHQADKDGVFCWVHSSEGGYPLMLSQQFEVDRVLEIDLDQYAKDVELPEVRDRHWGTYTLRYMIRQPRQS